MQTSRHLKLKRQENSNFMEHYNLGNFFWRYFFSKQIKKKGKRKTGSTTKAKLNQVGQSTI